MITTIEKIRDIRQSPCASYWLKNALEDCLNRDCVDALNDAEELVNVLKCVVKDAQGQHCPSCGLPLNDNGACPDKISHAYAYRKR